MYPKMPRRPAQLDELQHNVYAHREAVAGLITYDNKGALITASFNEHGLDYKALFDEIQHIIKPTATQIPRFMWRASRLSPDGVITICRVSMLIFTISVALMLIILYLSLGQRSSWWAPILTGSFSAIWGLGFVSFMGYDFDPVMLVIPFILTARDLSHGIQWQGRYYDELDRLDDKLLACATTTDVMLPPGLLSIIADIAGIIFIALGGIPVLKEIGMGGAVWLAVSLTMVFVFQPIFMSYLPRPRIRERSWLTRSEGRAHHGPLRNALDWLLRVPITPGVVRGALLMAGAGFILWGIGSGLTRQNRLRNPGHAALST